jgi:hypothetical protein
MFSWTKTKVSSRLSPHISLLKQARSVRGFPANILGLAQDLEHRDFLPRPSLANPKLLAMRYNSSIRAG